MVSLSRNCPIILSVTGRLKIKYNFKFYFIRVILNPNSFPKHASTTPLIQFKLNCRVYVHRNRGHAYTTLMTSFVVPLDTRKSSK